ncbi:MAG: ZIP family metal transporter [Candidatus Nanohaloarchaea archaeon]
MVVENIAAALILTGLLSGVGAFFLFVKEEALEDYLPYMVSLSVGTIFGGVFIHLVFKLANKYSYGRSTGLMILGGIIGSFLLEKLVHWHCHNRDHHVEAFSYVLVSGDAVHNVLDGILIASSFLASPSTGIASTVAVVMHKVPKEIGDFGVLVTSGFSRLRALAFNVAISGFMFLGAAIVLAASSATGGGVVPVLLPLVVGNFVYIAGSDLMPQMKDVESDWVKHVLVFSAGVGLMYAVPAIKRLAASII